jgi:bacterioferritin (cytochrome b1)
MTQQKLLHIVDIFRTKLATEQLQHADAVATIKLLNDVVKEKDERIDALEKELETYRVQKEKGFG